MASTGTPSPHASAHAHGTSAPRVHRIEVFPAPGCADPIGDALVRDAAALGINVRSARASRVYLLQGDLDTRRLDRVRESLLADPVVERSIVGVSPTLSPSASSVVEIHPLPGVMDPAALSVRAAIRDLLELTDAQTPEVATGWRYDLTGVSRAQAESLATRLLANPVIQRVVYEPFVPTAFPVGTPHDQERRFIPIRELNDDALNRLSRDAHLFLSLEEMQAIQRFYRTVGEGGRDPADIELETLAQTWSEHCVHKTLKSTVRYRRHEGTEARRHEGEGTKTGQDGDRGRALDADPIDWSNRPGHEIQPDGTIVIHNLLKSTVAAATHRLIKEGVDWTLSIFVDNSGVIAFDEETAVCIKVETHNHPSAIEPYGGAATGVGGCIRDVVATGLGSRPIANTDVFCVAHPDAWRERGTDSQSTGGRNSESAEGREERGEDTNQQCSDVSTGTRCKESTEAGCGPTHGSQSQSTSSPRHSAPLEHSAFLSSPSTTRETLPPGTLHPRRILQQVVAGVRDYGNRMGIPTVSGAVAFDNRYVGNPLVFCGCIGVMPRSRVRGEVKRGDLIVAIGGRTGRDGLHGATFSSAELEHTAADEFAHAVQIGNAITQKRAMDAILRAAETQPKPLFNGMTDCGAGGFSSAIGELGKSTGAIVHLERAPLKYAGLSYTEIWISEAQERFVLAVPEANLDALRRLCEEEGAELCVLGTFSNPPGSTPENPDLQLLFKGQEVGRLSMHFLHEGIPTPHREAVWKGAGTEARRHEGTNGRRKAGADASTTSPLRHSTTPPLSSALPALLAHPNIASKHWIIRQYDHEVRGNTVLRPLVGPLGRGPGDASIIQPVPGSSRALAISCGLQTGIGDPDMDGGRAGTGGDPYLMTIAAIDECVRNLVCVGADPARIAILDNFCWPSCKKPENLGSLVRAAEGCYDGAIAYRTPFVSGKDSLNNQLTVTNPDGSTRTIEIPPTLLITGMAIVPDVSKIVSMDAKRPGRALVLVSGDTSPGVAMGGSIYSQLFGVPSSEHGRVPRVDLQSGPAAARAVHELINAGLVHSAHDVSEGGALVAVAEMLIAGSCTESPFGARLWGSGTPDAAALFAELPSTYLLEVDALDATILRLSEIVKAACPASRPGGLKWHVLGEFNTSGRLEIADGERTAAAWNVEDLACAWRKPLDW